MSADLFRKSLPAPRALVILAAAAVLGRLLGAPGLGAEAPKPRARAEVEAVLAKAPKLPARDLRPLEVVLLADDKDHGPGEHDYPLWQARWQLLLGGKAAAPGETQVNLHGPAAPGDEIAEGAAGVRVSAARRWPGQEQLDGADLLVMFCYPGSPRARALDRRQIGQLEAFLARGGGFVPIHSATYTVLDLAGEDGRRLLALTGLAFGKSIRVRHGPMEVKVAAPEHPICLGLPATLRFVDEPYWPPTGDPGKVQVLATSDETASDQPGAGPAPQPMFWTHAYGKGRVFGCVMGHFNWTFDDPYFRILLLRGMAWAAGESPYRFDPLVLRGAAVN